MSQFKVESENVDQATYDRADDQEKLKLLNELDSEIWELIDDKEKEQEDLREQISDLDDDIDSLRENLKPIQQERSRL